MMMSAPRSADFSSRTLVYAHALASTLRGEKSARDAGTLGALMHVAATDADPGDRAGAHYLLAKVVQGTLGPNGFEKARTDLVDAAFISAYADMLKNEPVAEVRIEAARALAIATYETPKEMITKAMQVAVLECAGADAHEDYRQAIYIARRNIVSRQPAHLDAAMAEVLMKSPPPAEMRSLHYLTYQTRSETILDRPDLMTPRMIADFIKDAENSPVADVRSAYAFPLAQLADQNPRFREILKEALQINRVETALSAAPEAPTSPKRRFLNFMRRRDPS